MPDDRTIDFVVMFLVVGLLVLGLGSALLGWLVRTWDRIRGGVSRSEESDGGIMSSAAPIAPQSTPSSLQTDGRQTADRPMIPTPTREQMLDIFRVLRAAGVSREVLRAPWRAAGLPLDNNLWTQAAPDEPGAVTPIAGRPTRASFPDPDLEYQPPPH